MSRNVDPFSPVVITTPVIEAGQGYNVIPDMVEIKGTLRTFDMGLRNKVMDRIEKIVEFYSKAWDCEGTIELFRVPYPPTVNDPKLTEFVMEIAENLGPTVEAEPTMGAEDFAFYLQKVPGVFIFLGIKNEEKGIIYPHHHPKFDVDENVLWKGTALYSLLAYNFGTFE